MYVTRTLKMHRKGESEILSTPPIEGPHSGYLMFADGEIHEEAGGSCCWGICKDTQVRKLPFPQNKILEVVYTTSNGQNSTTYRDDVWFIPVVDQPISSNCYYVIVAKHKYKGLACTCSKDEDMGTCFCCNYIKDSKPSVLDHTNSYQQVAIFPKSYGFVGKSVEEDGFTPLFLRRKGWRAETSSSFKTELSSAEGLNMSLRLGLPAFDFPISSKRSPSVIVGKWYCPFVFVNEGNRLKDQMKESMLYTMNLEQWWEEIYTSEKDKLSENYVNVNVDVQNEVSSLFGLVAVKDDKYGPGNIMWYSHVDNQGEVTSLGLSSAIVEKMKLVLKLGGWIGGGDRDVKVERVEEYKGENGWNRFGCFVLVERFSLKRMDGTVVLTCDYRHTHQIQCKWE
ncbi:hypothetical protein ACHQM5_006840 [Ranunculus cassubicifolius]